MRQEAYPHPVDVVELRETHGAWVFLAGPFAYKLKKPVNLGFFDYSTRALRDADAAAELELNHRLAPAMYLGLVDIVERDGSVHVGGPGRVLERAVRMRRLPEEGMLTSLLERGEVSTQLMRRVAAILARFHARAPTGAGVDEFGAPANLGANWRENFEQIEPYIGTTIDSAQLTTIKRFISEFLRGRRDLLERRVAEGRIRDGHGDLHAGSICVVDGQILIFDCIQFSARYRCADVAAEVAFLAMDLDHAHRSDLASAFVAAYVARSNDAELRELLPFYKCYRAFVRGKVVSLRLGQGQLGDHEQAEIEASARSYFALAASYADVGACE
jgi:aminoglycoside phosphotransferase family enzyme